MHAQDPQRQDTPTPKLLRTRSVRIVDELTERLLVEHQRSSSLHCACGWGVPGKSHAAHVVAKLREAGVLHGR